MRWIVMVLIMIACILLVICYALMVMAHEADERAEKFYKEWQAKPKVEPKEVITTCVTVPMAVLEKKESNDGEAIQSADE